MPWLIFSASFEYLCYGSTAQGPSESDVYIRQNLTVPVLKGLRKGIFQKSGAIPNCAAFVEFLILL